MFGITVGVIAASAGACASFANFLGATFIVALARATCVVATDLTVGTGCIARSGAIAFFASLIHTPIVGATVFAILARGAFVGDTGPTVWTIGCGLAALGQAKVAFAGVEHRTIGDGLASFEAHTAPTYTARTITVLGTILGPWCFDNTTG